MNDKKKEISVATDLYYADENKVINLKKLIDTYSFLITSTQDKEHTHRKIKPKSWERVLAESEKGGIPSKKDISNDYSHLLTDDDYETKYSWYNEETKNSYFKSAYFDIDWGLKDSIQYVIQNNIPFGTHIFENFQLDYYKLKSLSIIIANYLTEVDVHPKEFIIEANSFYKNVKQEFTEVEFNRYNEITNILSKTEVTEVDKKKLKQRDTNKYIFGMKIAKGEVTNYWDYNKNGELKGYKNGFNRNQLAEKLKKHNEGFKKVIHETTKKSKSESTGNKNVFNDYKIMTLIIEDCKEQNIDIDKYFLKEYEEIRQKNI